MALTFSTGMTNITDADSATDWNASRIAGSGQFAGASLDTTVFIEGGGSIAVKMAGNNWNTVLMYDYYTANGNTALNLTTTGNEVIAMWVKMDTPGTALTQSSGGFYVLVSSSTETTGNPTNYSEWWVGGSDAGTEGWKLFMVDTRKTASATGTNPATLSAVRRIGFGVRNTSSVGNVKADNVFVDAMWYGRPNYQVIGDGVLTATWDDFATHSLTGDANSPNGLIEDIGGTLICKCGFTIGDSAQTATTTFSDSTSADILLKREVYHNGTALVDALNYSDYYNINGEESASFATSFTVGSVVGTGDGRQGVLGGSFSSQDLTNQSYALDFSTVTTANLYGIDIVNAKDGISLEGGQSVVGSQLINCGPLGTGTTSNGAEVLNSFVIDPTSSDGTNIGISIENSSSGGVLLTNLKNIGFITSGTPATQRFVGFNEANDFSVDFNDLIYYGNFTSATLYHGQNAGTNSDITINSKGESNVLESEFEELNGATVTVLATKTLTISGIEPGTELRVYTYTDVADPTTYTELVGAEDIDTVPTSSTFDTVITDPNDSTKFAATKSYDSSGGDFGVVLVAHNLDFIFFRESFTLSSTENTSFTVFQIGDRSYDAGSVQ